MNDAVIAARVGELVRASSLMDWDAVVLAVRSQHGPGCDKLHHGRRGSSRPPTSTTRCHLYRIAPYLPAAGLTGCRAGASKSSLLIGCSLGSARA